MSCVQRLLFCIKSEVCRLHVWSFGALFWLVTGCILASSIWTVSNVRPTVYSTAWVSVIIHIFAPCGDKWLYTNLFLNPQEVTHPIIYSPALTEQLALYIRYNLPLCEVQPVFPFMENPLLHLAFAPKTWGNPEQRSSLAGCLSLK